MRPTERTKLIVLILTITSIVVAIGLTIWSWTIMRNTEGYVEVMKAARHAARPQIYGGIGLLVIAYVLTYVKFKK